MDDEQLAKGNPPSDYATDILCRLLEAEMILLSCALHAEAIIPDNIREEINQYFREQPFKGSRMTAKEEIHVEHEDGPFLCKTT